jgi:hypothetical protein
MVAVANSCECLLEEPDGLRVRDGSRPAEDLVEGLALDKLDDEVARAINDQDFAQSDDVGVVQASMGSRLFPKPFDEFRIAAELAPQGLDRHHFVEQEVFGLVDRTHAADGDGSSDQILLTENLPGHLTGRGRIGRITSVDFDSRSA